MRNINSHGVSKSVLMVLAHQLSWCEHISSGGHFLISLEGVDGRGGGGGSMCMSIRLNVFKNMCVQIVQKITLQIAKSDR